MQAQGGPRDEDASSLEAPPTSDLAGKPLPWLLRRPVVVLGTALLLGALGLPAAVRAIAFRDRFPDYTSFDAAEAPPGFEENLNARMRRKRDWGLVFFSVVVSWCWWQAHRMALISHAPERLPPPGRTRLPKEH